MKVGFVGLGRMGAAMALRIVEGGFDLTVYNRTRQKTEECERAGARVASSVADACSGCDVAISMVANDAVLSEVTLGEGGIRESLAPGAIHLVMGTHGVAAIRALADAHAAAGQAMVAAPVLGRPEAVAAGELGIVAAGPAEAVDRCRPLLDAVGRRTFDAGPRPEGATVIKLANNFALGCAIEAMGEAYSLARKYGVEPEVLYEVMTGGLFAAPAYKTYGKIIVEEAYDHVGFTSELALKDADLILEAGKLAGVPLPSVELYRGRLLDVIARGEGERDWAVLALEQARASGLG